MMVKGVRFPTRGAGGLRKERHMTVIEIVNNRIAILQGSIDEQREKTRVFIPDFGECARVYRLIEDLELQVRTLKDIAAAIEMKGEKG